MERTVNRQEPRVHLYPGPQSWCLRAGVNGGDVREIASLDEAANTLVSGQPFELALPLSSVLLERMRLPSISREELVDMVRLQLEKTLPFAAEEVTSDFQIIGQTETESDILAFAVNNTQLDELCAPFRLKHHLPDRVTVFALMVAAKCPETETVCAIFREQGVVVFSVVEKGKLAHAQVVQAADADLFFSELPQILLTAELDGIATVFSRVILDASLGDWLEPAKGFFSAPVELVRLDQQLSEPDASLVPATWREEKRGIERAARLRSQLMTAGAIYLVFVLCAASYIIYLQHRVTQISRQIVSSQPDVDLIMSRKNRWETLAPAFDWHRYVVELLFQATKSLPSEDIRITTFDQEIDQSSRQQFAIDAEAPSAPLALEYGEQIKKNSELQDFRPESGKPAILPNNHAQFRITGKP